MDIAIFKPSNVRKNNAFYSGQYPIFRKMNESSDYKFTIFVDDPQILFEGLQIAHLEVNIFFDFCIKVLRKVFGLNYTKTPYYKNVDFSKFDVIITEGIHYQMLGHFKNYKGLLILNDSITAEDRIKNLDVGKVNSLFKDALLVAVNERIPILHKKYGIGLETVVIGHAVQLDKIFFRERTRFTGKIITVGRLVEEKGFIYIFNAIKNIIVDYPSVTLDVYGSGPLRKDLDAFIEEYGLQNHIKIFEPIGYEDLLKKFLYYDLFVSHPLETENVAEAFHMANIEAMASGIPVVTTYCGGVPYVVGECALVNKQKDVQALVSSIISLYNDEMQYNRFSKLGRNHVVKNYSLEAIQKKWTKILEMNT